MLVSSLIGKKTRQSQGFLQDGTRIPLTAVAVSGNFVSQVKTLEKEGYNALQLGIDNKKKANVAIRQHAKKAGLEQTPRFFREVRVETIEGIEAGAEIAVSQVFSPGDIIDVTGVSKGKGFAGGVKRYHFKGGPRTHGQSDRERAPGSIGQTTTPGRVYKGKRMAGRMGQDTVTVKNLEVIEVTNDGVLLIKGLVPGSLNSYVIVKKIGENKKFVPLYKEVELSLEKDSQGQKEIKKEDKAQNNPPLENVPQPIEAEVKAGPAQPEETVPIEKTNEEEAKEEVKGAN